MSEMDNKMISTLLSYKNIVRGIVRTWARRNLQFLMSYLFLEYLYHRLQQLYQQKIHWIVKPDIFFRSIIPDEIQMEYIDNDSYVIVNTEFFKNLQSSYWSHANYSSWCYVCSKLSMKRYKLMIVSLRISGDYNSIYISETKYHNLRNVFDSEQLNDLFLCKYESSPNQGRNVFPVPLGENVAKIADKVRISMIANPYNCPMKTVDAMLKAYFSYPRYLHTNDLFKVDGREHAKDRFYSSGAPVLPIIYFIVNSLQLDYTNDRSNVDSCFILYGVSTLIQETQINSYIPRKSVTSCKYEKYPLALSEPFECLESCIIPFMKKDAHLRVKPIFLLKGQPGCGKEKVVKMISRKLGLHLLRADFGELQTLIPAQTEVKVRTVLQKAKQCVPCMLFLNNIQIFGKTAEGEKDERIISVFMTEIAALYGAWQEFPLIIVAASNKSDLPAELQRIFIETICMKPLDVTRRSQLLEWLLSEKNLATNLKVMGTHVLSSDFRYADMLALSLHTAKILCTSSNSQEVKITTEDLDLVYKNMQQMYSDTEGMPYVPEIRWRDIGGLKKLRNEIISRLQLPLSTILGCQQSSLLLYGPPGTGKTMIAKAIATEYHMPFLSVKGPEVLNMYVGQSEKNIREIFERARSASPCIIFFDELDSLAPNRGRSGDSGGVMDRVVSQLLTEMDGLEQSSGIFILGATNRPDLIDPALLRPGRFDKMLYLGFYSDCNSKMSVLRAQTSKFKFKSNVELEEIIGLLPDSVTGADLYSVTSNAWLNAVREFIQGNGEESDSEESDEVLSIEEAQLSSDIIITKKHLVTAVGELVPSVSDEDIKRYNNMDTQLSSM